MNQLIELERQFPQFITPDSPTQKVGGTFDSSFKKVKHNKPMMSLSNVYNQEEIQAFIVGDTVYINSAYASDSRYAMHEILHTKITPKAREKIIAELKKSGYYESVHEAYAKAYEGLSSIDID